MVHPGYLQGARDMIQNNINNHVPITSDPKKVLGYKLALVNGAFVKMDGKPEMKRGYSRKKKLRKKNSQISLFSIQ